MTDTPLTLDHDTRTIEQELARLDRLATLLDSRFRLPGTSIRFGLDSIVGLVPGKWHLTRMAANLGIDYVIGAIPLIGDLFDIGFKANLRNLAILREGLDARTFPRRTA